MKFRNISVRTKILIGFFVIVSLVGFFGYASLNQLNRISVVINKDIPNSVESLVETSHLDGLVQAIQNYGEFLTDAVWNYSLAGELVWKERYEEVAPKLDKMIKKAENLGSEQNKGLLKKIDEANQELAKIERQAIEYIDNQQFDEAYKILEVGEYWDQKAIYESSILTYIDKRGSEYEKSIAVSTKILSTATEKYDNIVKASQRQVFYFSLSAVLLSLGLGLLVSFIISRQIVSVRNAAKKIAEGDLDKRVAVRSGDEIGQLAATFNEMASKLKESYVGLENKVKERTQELEKQKTALEHANEGIRYLNKELENKNKELQRLDQLKSDFVSVVSHELRTPLAITKEGIALVLDGVAGDINEKQIRMLSNAQTNIDRLIRIVGDILDVSKIESGKIELKRELVDIVALVHQVCSSFDDQIKKEGLELKVDVPDKKVEIYADSDRLIQIFTNLVSNSLKFTEKGFVKVSVREEDEDVKCSVADTGKGMSKADQIIAFDKFQQVGTQVTKKEKGTGLGLTIVKNLVELHHGDIWIESEVGRGTTIAFSLPKYASGEYLKKYVNVNI